MGKRTTEDEVPGTRDAAAAGGDHPLADAARDADALFDNAPVGICQVDPYDGLFLKVNPRFCAITGYAEAELLGRHFLEIVHPDDRSVDFQAYLALGRGQIPRFQTETRCVRKDGAVIWGEVKVIMVRDASGQPLHALAVISDITQRKQLQTQLEERSAQLQRERNFIDTILDTMGAVVLVIDADGRLVRYNAACSATTGYDFAEFQGGVEWLDILIPGEDKEGVGCVLEKLRSGQNQVLHENHWTCRDGSQILLSWRNTVLRDEGGRVLYIIATGIDITEQSRAEEQSRQHLEEASRLQRMQTANELATQLAHELNQPLAAIASYAAAGQQLLHNTPLDQEKLERNLEQISQQSLRAGQTIRHMRAFVGRGRIDPVPLDLNAVVRSTCALMVPKAYSRGIELVLDIDATLPQVMGVDVHIEQVLLNLIRNAIDVIRDTRKRSGSIVVATGRDGGMARVSVRDSGPGLDAAMAVKVFEPFASRKEYGLGVGLRISRSLIEAHGGRLWVEPHTPGAIFHFVLPFAP